MKKAKLKMRYLNKIKIKKNFLILCISLLIFSSLGSISFSKFTDIESTLSSNVGNDGLFTCSLETKEQMNFARKMAKKYQIIQ